jgi:hypothetical protein
MSWFRTVVVCGLALAACDDPPLKIIYEIADGTSGQGCATSKCSELDMSCDSVLHLRILSPSDPNVPHVSICKEVMQNVTHDLCAIGRVDLEPKTLPRETLEVQVTVWPKDAVTDPLTGLPDCARTQVEFDATGFPTNGPAFGGRAFYHPGDAETVVTLGCTDKKLIAEESCTSLNDVAVTATVLDFDNLPVSVGDSTADRLSVAIGEPTRITLENSDFVDVLNSADLRPLARTAGGPELPAWAADVEVELDNSACIQVTEDAAEITSTLRCEPVTPDARMIDMFGVRVSNTTLDEILAAMSLAEFPEDGMTLGIVIDENNNPAAGATVTVDQGTIEFINADRTGIATGTKTTASGIFVSRDATYGSFFSASLVSLLGQKLGGRVNNKLTVVVFLPESIGGQ